MVNRLLIYTFLGLDNNIKHLKFDEQRIYLDKVAGINGVVFMKSAIDSVNMNDELVFKVQFMVSKTKTVFLKNLSINLA